MGSAGFSPAPAIFVLVIVAIWGPVGWVGYKIGKAKNRPGTGLLLGLVLGVIGWVAIALLPPAPPR